MVDWSLRVLKLETTLQIEDSHYLTKIKFTHFWHASMTFPLTEGLEYPEFKGLDHRGMRNQPALPTVSPHLPQDALNKAHWKFFPPAVHIRSRKNAALEASRVESTQRERERERVWTCPKGIKAKDRQGKPLSVAPQQTGPDRALPVATRPNSWNLSLDSELIKTAQKSRATTGVPTGVSCSPQRVSPWSHHPSFA